MAGAYAAFAGRWRAGAHIASSSAEFRAEADAVFKALHERFRREEQELYPFAERVPGAGRRDG